MWQSFISICQYEVHNQDYQMHYQLIKKRKNYGHVCIASTEIKVCGLVLFYEVFHVLIESYIAFDISHEKVPRQMLRKSFHGKMPYLSFPFLRKSGYKNIT